MKKIIMPRVVVHKSDDRYIGRDNQRASPSVTEEAVFVGLTPHQIELAFLRNQDPEVTDASLWWVFR